ncbi:hypothetical protein DPX16_14409 [Anabarilius grahami]|uniref:Uncharacterized protein n=1 Tax=Anabarilius grahami TaxID=495550 RepID=A0A3N0XQ86_ANAGA|nr:hypothetical protein DPX16_14409 [Anabarilius grahami]
MHLALSKAYISKMKTSENPDVARGAWISEVCSGRERQETSGETGVKEREKDYWLLISWDAEYWSEFV